MSKKLLLADDSVVIQKLVGLSFANEDVEIVSTDNGDDALAMAREIQPDIILADVVMPGMSGYEVCEAVKQDSSLAGTPVLLLTGTFEAFDEDRATSVGADGQITKPFEAQALVERVTEVMNAPKTAPVTPATDAAQTPAAASFDAEETVVAGLADLPPATAGPQIGQDLAGGSSEGSGAELFDKNIGSLSDGDDGLGIAIGGKDPAPNASSFPLGQDDANESTASGLFGAPGDGAQDRLDEEGGALAIGQSVGRDAPAQEDATIAVLPDARSQAVGSPGRGAAVDLGAALDAVPTDSDSTIIVGQNDINASTSPNLSDPLQGDAAPADSGSDALTVHAPSSAIDQAGAMAPTPPEIGPRVGVTGTSVPPVADLDARLGESSATATVPPASPDLDLGPSVVGGDDLDFAFDVSEQISTDQLDESRDTLDDSFSSLMDISESSILGSSDPADVGASGREAEISTAGRTPDRTPELTPDITPDRTPDMTPVGAGYDVSSSDLATAERPAGAFDTTETAAPSAPAAIVPPEPEPLIEIPNLPPSHSKPDPGVSTREAARDVPGAATDAPLTGANDLFDGLSTGSVMDEVDAESTYTALAGSATPFDIRTDAEILDEPDVPSANELDARRDLLEDAAPDSAVEPPPARREPIDLDLETDLEASAPHQTDDDDDDDVMIATPAATDRGESVVPDLSPLMEERIRESLEKVAWEAFSDLSESIVKQVMGRVEQIAWEVIPQMAETLVREEIRKMKGDED